MRGFTLIELAVTVAIIAILASVALPLGELVVQRGQEQELRRALREIREALDAYKVAADDGRINRKPGQSGYPARLEDLVTGVEDAKSARRERIHFLRRLPRDPFADRELPAVATWGKRSYASPADNPREGEDVYDVYSLSNGRGIDGRPYRDW